MKNATQNFCSQVLFSKLSDKRCWSAWFDPVSVGQWHTPVHFIFLKYFSYSCLSLSLGTQRISSRKDLMPGVHCGFGFISVSAVRPHHEQVVNQTAVLQMLAVGCAFYFSVQFVRETDWCSFSYFLLSSHLLLCWRFALVFLMNVSCSEATWSRVWGPAMKSDDSSLAFRNFSKVEVKGGSKYRMRQPDTPRYWTPPSPR